LAQLLDASLLEQNCRAFAAIWPRSMGMSAGSGEKTAGQGVKRRKIPMTKLFAGAAAAFLFAGVAFAGEPAPATEVVEAEAAVEAVAAEADGEAEAVEADASVEAEVGPATADGEEGVAEEAPAE
jgi:hypothetical protein